MEYPIYCSTENESVLYCIKDENSFRELKRLGATYLPHEFLAKDYPDRLFVHDLLSTFNKGQLKAYSSDSFERLWMESKR